MRAVALELAYAGPFDWDAMLAFLAARAIPGVELVRDSRYLRSFALGRSRGLVEVRAAPRRRRLLVEVRAAPAAPVKAIGARVRHLFDLDADTAAIDRHLAKDPLLADRVRARPGVRVPGAWDPFELAVRAVLGQQITVAAATLFSGRLARERGSPLPVGTRAEGAVPHLLFPAPAALTGYDFTRIGLTRARSETLRGLAQAVAADQRVLRPRQSLAQAIAELGKLRGIGAWTAHYIAMRAMHEPDAFPATDLGLLRALGDADGRPSPQTLERIAASWRPWRAYAALRLWLQ